MYFIQKNLLNVLIVALTFGVMGTVINFFVPSSSTTYEEYYILDGELSPNAIANLNIELNKTINNNSDTIKIAKAEGQTNSNMLQLTINAEAGMSYSSIQKQVMNLLAEQNITVSDSEIYKIYSEKNVLLKLIIILLSLLTGTVIGILSALNDRNISTEEDVQYYLGEKTLGTF